PVPSPPDGLEALERVGERVDARGEGGKAVRPVRAARGALWLDERGTGGGDRHPREHRPRVVGHDAGHPAAQLLGGRGPGGQDEKREGYSRGAGMAPFHGVLPLRRSGLTTSPPDAEKTRRLRDRPIKRAVT